MTDVPTVTREAGDRAGAVMVRKVDAQLSPDALRLIDACWRPPRFSR